MAKRYRSGTITLEVADILEQVDDDDLRDELASRDLAATDEADEYLDACREAHLMLMRNKPCEARIILERILFPKWKSVDECRRQAENGAA